MFFSSSITTDGSSTASSTSPPPLHIRFFQDTPSTNVDFVSAELLHQLNYSPYHQHLRYPAVPFETHTATVAYSRDSKFISSGASRPFLRYDYHDDYDSDVTSKPLNSKFVNIPTLRRLVAAQSPLYAKDAMIAEVDDASTPTPGSPPELTGSKSSKSSSFHSSYQSEGEDVLADISHFEEIGLEDDGSHEFVAKEAPPAPYTSTYANDLRETTRKPSVRTKAPLRDLTNPKSRSAHLSLRGQARGVAQEAHGFGLMPGATVSRRGLTSASTPSLTMPMKPRMRSTSPKSDRSISPRTYPVSARQRRGSWQSNRERKTSEELEREFDEEDGDDIPDHYALENIPISPRPIEERALGFPMNGELQPEKQREKRPKTKSVGNGTGVIPVEQGSLRSPLSPKPGMPPRGISMGQFPINYNGFGRPPRAKSWTAALSELSEEAKALTQALEEHADEQTLPTARRSASSAPSNKRRVQSSIAELPPLRKTNIMIDPLPVSKEKEAVLSRTRPSWLPPKNPEEERRHLKEYQKMMAMSIVADRRREEEMKARMKAKDETSKSLLRIWEEHVLPNWDAVTSQKRTRELWWRGISPRSRGKVWQRAIGNELELTMTSYHAALRRAKDLEKLLQEGGGSTEEKRKGEWFAAIHEDVRNTFPELRIFRPGGPLCESLTDVLMAYSMYRSDLGYITGMNTITALLLLNLPDAPSTFVTLCNMLNRQLPLSFLTSEPNSTSRVLSLTLTTISNKLPTLYNHLNNAKHPTINFSSQPELYLYPIFRSLFTKNLDLDSVTRLWDVWVFEGDAVMVRAAVAMFMCAESKLYAATTSAEVQNILNNLDVSSSYTIGPHGKRDEEKWMRAVRDAGRGTKSAPGTPVTGTHPTTPTTSS